MGRTLWSTFDRLKAADVQTLGDQTVMRFATAAARDEVLGVGVREVGMMSAVAASPDFGAPRYWDGSSWELMSAGVQTPNPLVVGEIGTVGSVSASQASAASGTWYQVSAGLGSNVLVYAVQVSTGTSADDFELGTGAASSEVTRFVGPTPGGSATVVPEIPYGMYVPSGKRIAMRFMETGSPTLAVTLLYVTVAGGTEVQAGRYALTLNTTAWSQVAASPPLAGGVEIVGLTSGNSSDTLYGFGAASAEVVQATLPRITPYTPHPPLSWPASTRFAARNATSQSKAIRIYWRESLA